ncbi:hypothetical protein DFH28DRAFT_984480 [Melampsora americana]|nr:hypothetical protein DFH28DRAFT_984480 [Melampsora americana]
MKLNQQIIATVMMAFAIHTICISIDEASAVGTTTSFERFNSPSKIYIDSAVQIGDNTQDRYSKKPHWLTTLTLGRQTEENTPGNYVHPLQIEALKGKKRLASMVLDPPSRVYPTASYDESAKHPNFIDQIEDTIPNQGIRIHSDESWNPLAFKFPSESFDTEQQKPIEKPWASRILLTDEKKTQFSQPGKLKTLSDRRSAYQYDPNEDIHFQRYTFMKSGKTVLLPNSKVQKIGDSWHVTALTQDIVNQLRIQGLQIAINAGLHPKGGVMHPWFQKLEEIMQHKLSNGPQQQLDSIVISWTILKVYRHLTMQFLASLHMIHSGSPEELGELTHDGWNFILEFLECWKQLNWNEAMIEEIDTSRCLGTFTPFQILSYLINLAPDSRVSMGIVWSIYNNWFNVSTYRNKVKVSTLQEFVKKIDYTLAKRNLLPNCEVQPSGVSTILELGHSSSNKITQSADQCNLSKKGLYKKHSSVDRYHCKTVVSRSKEVGEKILCDLSNKGALLEFITDHCNHMKQKMVQLPPSWKGNYESLMRRLQLDISLLLYPTENPHDVKNPAVINGFQFLQELLRDWSGNTLERACQVKFKCAKSLDLYDDIPSAILAYLLKLSPGRGSEVASTIFWLLWKGWDRWDGSNSFPKLNIKKSEDFMAAIEKLLPLQIQL